MTPSNDRRVLVVYQSLPHYRRDVFRELQETPGLKVEFAAGETNIDGSILSIEPGALETVHQLRNHWRGKFLWQSGLIRLLVTRRWDDVIFLGDFGYLSTWFGAALMRVRPKTRVYFWTIGWHRPEDGLRRRARLSFYRLADGLLLYGDVAREWGKQMGYPENRMHTIYNSSSRAQQSKISSPEELRSLRQRLPGGSPTVGTVIRLNANKRLDLLLEAAAHVRATTDLDLHVALAGDGTERERLRALAERLRVPLSLPGAIYREDELAVFYEACQVSAIPTLAGLSVLQSFRFGRPVVTHDDPTEQVPESEAIIPGVTGGLYRKGDIDDFARLLVDWVQKVTAEPDEVAQTCRSAIQSKWSPAAQAGAIAGVLRQGGVAP